MNACMSKCTCLQGRGGHISASTVGAFKAENCQFNSSLVSIEFLWCSITDDDFTRKPNAGAIGICRQLDGGSWRHKSSVYPMPL